MKTQNNVQLIGYLGGDPKIFKTPSGDQFATFQLATDHYTRTDKELNKKITYWHCIQVWGKARMPFIRNNFMKGSHVLVDGMIEYYTTTNPSGVTQNKTVIRGIHLINLDR